MGRNMWHGHYALRKKSGQEKANLKKITGRKSPLSVFQPGPHMHSVMSYSQDGIKLTKGFEGLRLRAYKDGAGVITIGYGHTRKVFEGMEITEEIANAFLRADIREAELCVNNCVTLDSIPQNMFDALVDFVFNLGCSALRNSTMLKLLNNKNFAGAANEFEKWSHVSGKVVAGLLRRRMAEELIFTKGEK